MLDSTRVQIKPRKESSGAVLNLHKRYLFLKYDLVKMKLENWKTGKGDWGPWGDARLHDGWKMEAFSDLGSDHEETDP